jgi:hypothetical protein
METLKARKAQSEEFQALNENNFSSRILTQQSYHTKLTEQ